MQDHYDIVFLVVVHKAPEQVERLLRALAHPSCLSLLHIDAKSRAQFAPHLSALDSAGGNVAFLDSMSVTWGGLSQVRVFLEGLRWLRDHGVHYGHVTNVSGQCFPLVPSEQMCSVLRAQEVRSFLRFRHLESEWPKALRRVKWLHMEAPMGHGRVTAFPIPLKWRYPDFDWYGGSSWVWLSQDATNVLLDHTYSQWLYHRLRFANSADEVFFQTALKHLLPADLLGKTNFRYERWQPHPTRPGRFLPNPRVLGEEDLNEMREAAHDGALLARKLAYERHWYDQLEASFLGTDAGSGSSEGPVKRMTEPEGC